MFKKVQKTKQNKNRSFIEMKDKVMCSDTDSEFEADPIKNGDLFQKSLATKKSDDKKTG